MDSLRNPDTSSRRGREGLHLGFKPEAEATRWVLGGWTWCLSGRSLNKLHGTTLLLTRHLQRGTAGVRYVVNWAAVRGQLWLAILITATWNTVSQVARKPKLEWEVKRYWLDIIRITSTHRRNSGTNLPKKGWILFLPSVPLSERQHYSKWK